MADLITIKSGALGGRETMPNLAENELGYCTDKRALYIGTASGNVRLCGAEDAEKIQELNNTIISLNGQIETMSKAIEDITARLDEVQARLEALEAPTETPSE